MISIAIETILGALTGYVTNDVALRQLFRDGGVVEKERASFIDMLVDMLQHEILDEETMKDLAENEAVVEFFEALVQRMLHDILPRALEDGDIDTVQRYEALLSLLEKRLGDVSWPAFHLEPEALGKAGEAFLADAYAWQELWHLLGQESLFSLGLGKPLEQGLHRLSRRPVHTRQAWLERQEMSLQRAFEAGAQVLYPVLHEDLTYRQLAETVGILVPEENSLEKIIGMLGRTLSGHPDFSEVVLEVIKHHLEEILQLHLPELLQLLESMLAGHHHELEIIVFSAMDEALEEVREPFRSLVRKSVGKRLEGDTGWFVKLFATLQEDELLHRLSCTLSRFIQGKVEKQVYNLQHEADPGAAALAIYRQLPQGVRDSLESRVEAKLDQTILAGVTMEAWSSFVKAAGQSVLLRIIEEDRYWGPMRTYLSRLVRKPLHTWLLTPARREQLQIRTNLWWQSAGRNILEDLLAQQYVSGQLMGEFLFQTVQKAVHVPPVDAYQLLLRHLGTKEEEILAAWLRSFTFSQLPDFVGRLTHERLEALTQKELRQLVLDLLGKEMRPLSYLGAGVGAVAGVATGSGMALSGIAPDPQIGAEAAALFAGRSFFYGAVGYGTNVMAVKGLFRPYKRKLGWQGLLPKNQARFASKMSEMADTYVLNNTIWDNFARQALERWEGHRGSVADRMSTPEMLDQTARKAQKVWPELPAVLLVTAATAAVPTLLQQRDVKNRLAFHLAQGTEALLKGQFGRFPYQDHILSLLRGAGASPAFEPVARNVVQQALKRQMHTSVNPWRQVLTAGTDSLILPESEDFVPLAENFSKWVLEKAPPFIKQFRPVLSEKLADEVFERLPFLLQMGFAAMDGEGVVDHALEIVLEQYIPTYMERHEKIFAQRMSAHLTAQWSGRSLTDLGWVWSQEEVIQVRKAVLDISLDLKIDETIVGGFRQLVLQPEGVLEEATADALGIMSRQIFPDMVEKSWGEGVQVFFRHLLTGLSTYPVADWLRLAAPLQKRPLYAAAGVPLLGQWITPKTAQGLNQGIASILQLDDRERNQVLRPFLLELGDRVYPPVVDYIREEGRVLVSLVDLPGITRRQMDALNPEELEGLVRQIANPYFRHVERMGWWGAVVAVPASIMVLLFS